MGPGIGAIMEQDRTLSDLYAFVSHESAIEINRGVDRGLWQPLARMDLPVLPVAELCVRTQKQCKAFLRDTGCASLRACKNPVHLLVPHASARSSGKTARIHVWEDQFPDGAFIRMHEQVFVSSPSFAVLQMALARRACRPTIDRVREGIETEEHLRSELGLAPSPISERELLEWENTRRMIDAVRVFMEFAGSYRLECAEESATAHGVSPTLTCDGFRSFIGALPALKGVQRARSVASYAAEGSGSAMETALFLILTLPVELGGFGLPHPCLNRPIRVAPIDANISSKEEMRVDLLWSNERVAVEYDSWEYHGARGSSKLCDDNERANSLEAMGYRVLSVGREQALSLRRIGLLAHQIARLLGTTLPRPTEAQLAWRTRLCALLLPSIER